MKKQEPVRKYNFSDAKLVLLAKEKAAFITRDASSFAPYGITAAMAAALVTNATTFSNLVTDTEAASDMTNATDLKNTKGEQLRVAIRGVMSRVEQKFVVGSSKHKRFGTAELSEQPDADLLITAKRVVRAGTLLLAVLASTGLTAAILSGVSTLAGEFETLVVDLQMKIGDRDDLQEDRVEAGNVLYTTLVTYTNTGQTVWETTDAAKFNDYVIYNTDSGGLEEMPNT